LLHRSSPQTVVPQTVVCPRFYPFTVTRALTYPDAFS
jgi:hypothetical protein